jgi:COP9 signalosome complex subunit 7
MADQKYLAALQPFILLAKSATGRAAADLVVQATQAPGCYVFSELLECPNIQALSSTPDGNKYLELLRIFAYGSLADYRGELQDCVGMHISLLTVL